MSTPKVQLLVGDKLYSGWSSVRVTRSIESMCGSFALDVFDRWAYQQTAWPLRVGQECSVLLIDTPVIRGSVDRRSVGLGKGAAASVSGRDATSLLVDCSCALGRWSFHNVDLLAFAQKVCAPYGIHVRLEGVQSSQIAVPKKLSIEPGDTAAQAIENACRVAGLLPVADGSGGLVLTRPGTGRCSSALAEGVNLLRGSVEHDITKRHHTVNVLGQRPGSDQASGAGVLSKGSAVDETIDPRRVTYVRAEGAVDSAQAKARAQWEVAVRAAQGETVEVTTQGWAQASGELWPINRLVRVQSPTLELDNDLVIVSVTYSLSRDTGATTQLTLRRPDAYRPMPVLKPVSGSGGWAELKRGV